MTDDTELLRHYAETGAESAFAELVRRRIDFVYAAALRQANGNAALAADVTQMVFTALARKAAALARHTALVGWLHTATRFTTARAIRTETRRQAREHAAHVMEETLRESAPPADWAEMQPVLDEVLGELKERERTAILLRFFEGRPLAEVGAKLSLSEPAARSCVDRALDKMRDLLARRGVTSTAAALGVALANQVAVAAPAGLAASVTSTALAGAAVAGGTATAATLFNLMSTTKIVSGVAGVVALLAVGTAVFQAKSSRETSAALAAVVAERNDLSGRLAAMQAQAQQSDDSLAALQKEIGTLRAAAKPAEASPSVAPKAQFGSTMEYVLDHPEMQAAQVQQQTLRAKTSYARFFKDAGLAVEQQDNFLKVLEKRMTDELDLMAALHAKGYGVGNMPKDPKERAQLQKVMKENAENFQTNLRALLGDDLFKQCLQYSNTIPERNVAEQVASQLYDTDTPLTRQQADALMRVLTQNRFTARPEPSPTTTMNGTFITPTNFNGRMGQVMQQSGMNPMVWAAPVTDAALANARTVLTPAQFAVLQQVQAQQVTQFQLAPPPPGAAALKPGNAK